MVPLNVLSCSHTVMLCLFTAEVKPKLLYISNSDRNMSYDTDDVGDGPESLIFSNIRVFFYIKYLKSAYNEK